ncbi:lysylphosphatidylglycerol synthase transmembrane domain-containing protein [Salinisphaera sp. Q1T1-3]|uniref:lysylphosphatidylglycerol synthase transmembrane domain-containing protein n=1 Tax=Salinisphaera sp. Q1T1-3 TaxID=2321229 RepID=UPI000E7509C0|nr:lysylphosphatidylglycerol synthase transmembrane domain-containing protein [Salinisphaera sp. Q1T1-3]RJS92531.1 UPF0104 family protein [Salinisphaera sp. Q1T1-3]
MRPIDHVAAGMISYLWRARSIRVLTAAGLLGLVAIGVGDQAVAARLDRVRWPMIAVAVLLVQAQIVLSGLRWRMTAQALGQALSRHRAVAEYYVASLLNQVLPGGVSGDVLRAARNRPAGDNRVGWTVAVHAVVIERLAGQAALVLVAAVGLLIWLLTHGHEIDGAVPLVAGAVSVLAAAGLLVAAAARWAPARLARLAGIFAGAVRAAWLGPGLFLRQAGLSLAIVAGYLGVFALAGAAVGAPLSFPAAIALVPLVLLTMLVPVSIAGWGVRETAAAALWPLAGASAADGVATSIVYGLVSLVGALPGAMLLLRRRLHVVRPVRQA